MVQRVLRGLFLFVLFLGLSTTVFAQSSDPIAVSDEELTIDDGPHFFADQRLLLEDTYLGIVFAAGGDVELTGTIDGDFVVAGGNVTVDGSVTSDVYAAGGTVIINGDVGGNVIAAGGEIVIGEGAEVSGNVIAGSQAYAHRGTVLGDVMVGGKNIKLAGVVGQSAKFEAEKLEIGGTAMIGENLQAEVRRESRISDEAQVVGERNVSIKPQTEQEKKSSPVSWSMNWLFGLVGRLVVISTALALFGTTIKKAASVFDRRWPDALWKGSAFAILVPFAALVLFITIVGMPAAFLVGLAYVFVMMTAWVMPGFWLGRLLVPKVSQYAQGAVGATIISLVTFIPVFGWLVRLLLAVLGVGALIDLWRRSK